MPGETAETTIDDLLAECTARETSVRVLLRQDMVQQHAVLVAELERLAVLDGESGSLELLSPAAAAAVVAFEAEMDAALREFRFRSIGRRAWRDLLAQHPPSKEDRLDRLDYNPLTFPVAAVAASCVSPRMSLEQATKLEALTDLTEFGKLSAAAFEVNIGGNSNPKAHLAGRIARVSAGFGTTAVDMGSPDHGSLGG